MQCNSKTTCVYPGSCFFNLGNLRSEMQPYTPVGNRECAILIVGCQDRARIELVHY